MQPLEHDRRAGFELREHARDVGDAGERRRPPGEVGRVARHRRARLHEPEARRPDPRLGDQPLDVPHGEEVVETAFLPARDDERLPLPVLREEALGLDRRNRACREPRALGVVRVRSESSPSESLESLSSVSPSVVSVSSPSASSAAVAAGSSPVGTRSRRRSGLCSRRPLLLLGGGPSDRAGYSVARTRAGTTGRWSRAPSDSCLGRVALRDERPERDADEGAVGERARRRDGRRARSGSARARRAAQGRTGPRGAAAAACRSSRPPRAREIAVGEEHQPEARAARERHRARTGCGSSSSRRCRPTSPSSCTSSVVDDEDEPLARGSGSSRASRARLAAARPRGAVVHAAPSSVPPQPASSSTAARISGPAHRAQSRS